MTCTSVLQFYYPIAFARLLAFIHPKERSVYILYVLGRIFVVPRQLNPPNTAKDVFGNPPTQVSVLIGWYAASRRARQLRGIVIISPS